MKITAHKTGPYGPEHFTDPAEMQRAARMHERRALSQVASGVIFGFCGVLGATAAIGEANSQN